MNYHGSSIASVLQRGLDAQSVSVNGWVRSVRKQKRIAFAAVSDGSTAESLQAVLKPEDATEYVVQKMIETGNLTRILDYLMEQL